MSTDFSTVLLKDDRLVCSPNVTFAVIKGAMNNTVVEFPAIAGTFGQARPTTLTWNIQVPSQQIVCDRRLMIESTIRARIKKNSNDGNDFVFNNNVQCVNNGGVSSADCLNAFPFHQLINTAQVTINNTTVNCTISDNLSQMIRFNDSRDLNEYNGTTPIGVDRVALYGTTVSNSDANSVLSPFGTADNIDDEAYVPRGSFPVVEHLDAAGNFGAVATTPTPTIAGDAYCWIEFTVREPLLVSPFTFSNPKQNSQGIYGLQNMAIVLNIDSTASRLIRSRPRLNSATGARLSTSSVETWNIQSSKILMNFLTPQPSDLLVPRNVVPYYELPAYKYAIPGNNGIVNIVANNERSLTIQRQNKITFNPIQLNQIPDKLIICVKPTSSAYSNPACSDHYLGIEKININFNNNSGLLSTWTQQELYRASRENGCKQSWNEWSGQQQTNLQFSSLISPIGNAVAGVQVGNNGGLARSMNLPSTGSLLVLCFGKDIELNDYYAPGSLGNFNLQFTLDCYTYSPYGINDNEYELVVTTMNSGCFVTEKGQSSVYTGLLTKNDVLNANAMEPITMNDFSRMVGGSFWDTLKSIGSKVWSGVRSALPYAAKVANVVAPALGPYGVPIASGLNVANSLIGKGGVSDGSMSAGAMGYGVSGGRRGRKASMYVER